jgi:syntaxin-binding protein 5
MPSIDYSSILLHVGTNLGHLATFKVLPESNGGYSAHFAGSTSLEDKVVHIGPINADTGLAAYATQSAVSGLRDGFKTNGVLVTVTQSGARVFKPATSKGANKTWDEFLCYAAAVTHFGHLGTALVGLFGDGRARAYSIPALKEIAAVKVDHILDVRRFSEAVIGGSGSIMGWTGPSEVAVINVWGTGQRLYA